MTDELLPYYQRELTYIRKLGAEFARQHPKIAGRLRLREEETQDPHVERLIEAFAFLTARIRHKLDDEFPEIAQALLDVLYPHYLAPIPSMAVVRMTLDRSQTELTSPLCLPVGTSLDAATADGDVCRFRTCYPVRLWPIEVTSAELTGPPFAAPPLRFTQPVRSVLRVRLSHYSREATFAQLELDGLRFFLQAQPQQAYPLYELILNHTLGLAVANGDDRDAAVRLPAAALQPVGFGVDEGMLPYPKRSFLGYRLLTEYFVFPQKFLFFDVSWEGIREEQRERLGYQVDLFVYLSRQIPELEQQVSA
ncbi:MAG: type VI secretion system baseplate subunit TssF, partial [Planctomycetes bacterium]|nr:type VI secretion system baseplate subunit TssF [Planctomycetota bacterium]